MFSSPSQSDWSNDYIHREMLKLFPSTLQIKSRLMISYTDGITDKNAFSKRLHSFKNVELT